MLFNVSCLNNVPSRFLMRAVRIMFPSFFVIRLSRNSSRRGVVMNAIVDSKKLELTHTQQMIHRISLCSSCFLFASANLVHILAAAGFGYYHHLGEIRWRWWKLSLSFLLFSKYPISRKLGDGENTHCKLTKIHCFRLTNCYTSSQWFFLNYSTRRSSLLAHKCALEMQS